MAIGFTPKHQQEIPLDNLSPEQFIVVAIEAVKKLEWEIGRVNEKELVAYTKFSMSSWSEEVKIRIDEEKAIIKSSCTGNQLIDWGKNKRNIRDFVLIFTQVKTALSPEELLQKVEGFRQSQTSEGEAVEHLSPAEPFSDFLSIFKPAAGYFVTPILVHLNTAIFILMAITGVHILSPDSDSLLLWGANFKMLTLQGEWWRLLTCCFIHIGILHLLMNMYGLIYIGALLEPYLGKARFTAAYLLSGICGSITSLYWHDLTISAGASGAIFGMYGVFLAMLTTNLIEKSTRKAMLTSTMFFVGYNLLYGLKGGIDNAAHIGGLIGGLLIGYAFYPGLQANGVAKLKYYTIGILSAVVLSVSFIVYNNLPNNLAEYDKRMEKFISMESMALEVYNMSPDKSKEDMLIEIKDRGIYYWKENIKLLNDMKSLELPNAIVERNNKLTKYCELRIKAYELIYKQINENSEQYKNQIEGYDKQIQLVVDELSGGNK